MELVLLSNEFSVDPVIRAPITPETVGFVFTPSRDGKMWAMIVDRAAKSGVLGINSQSMMHSLHNAKGGKLCSFGGTLVSTGEVTTLILFDCDASSGLTIGAPYTLFVYVEDLSGGAGTMKSIDFAVPEVVSNYFDGPSSIVRGSLSTSGVSVTTRALLDGHAWIIVEDATVELSTIASLKASLCRSSVPVVAGVHTVLSVSTCTLIRNRAYNVYVYVESSKEMNDGTLSAAMMVEVMSNEFSTDTYRSCSCESRGVVCRVHTFAKWLFVDDDRGAQQCIPCIQQQRDEVDVPAECIASSWWCNVQPQSLCNHWWHHGSRDSLQLQRR